MYKALKILKNCRARGQKRAGGIMDISDMTDSHLVNTIKLNLKNGNIHTGLLQEYAKRNIK